MHKMQIFPRSVKFIALPNIYEYKKIKKLMDRCYVQARTVWECFCFVS